MEWLEKTWQKITSVLLGEPLYEVTKYEDYLKQHVRIPKVIHNMAVIEGYENARKIIPTREIEKLREPLSINDIKDIDNLLELVRERFAVVGDIKTGRIISVSNSSGIVDSSFVHLSNTIIKSRYIAYSSYVKECGFVFGGHDLAWTDFALNSYAVGGGEKNARVFESFYVLGASDIYFSHNVAGCSECMFSVFQRGRRYVIGNHVLFPDKYFSIKKHLLEQIRDLLKERKLPSIYELLNGGKERAHLKSVEESDEVPPRIQKAYEQTTRAIFGEPLRLRPNFLRRNLIYYDLALVQWPNGQKTAVGGKEYYMVPDGFYERAIPEWELESVADRKAPGIDLEHLMDFMGQNGVNFFVGAKCENCKESPLCFYSSFAYRTVMPVRTKYAAYSFWPRESSYIFGSSSVFDSSFLIRSYRSERAFRSFEVDVSNGVSDGMYLFMADGLRNGLFCFGIKGKSNVILNQVFDKEEVQRVKSYVLDWIKTRLNEGKEVPRLYELVSEDGDKKWRN